MRTPEYRVWVTAPKEAWLGCDEYETFDWDNRMRMVSSIHFPLGSYSGKDISAEAISEPDYYADGWLGANYSDENTIESFDYILMEYTGLKDKNGVKIFDGDILKSKGATEPEEKGFLVKFDICRFRFLNINFLDVDSEIYEIHTDDLGFISEQLEIIGNLYQNPELL